jgi:WD40 repeat protein
MRRLLLYFGIGIVILGILGSIIIALHGVHQVNHAPQPAFPPIGTHVEIMTSTTSATSSSYLSWSKDGQQLYSLRQNGTVQLWDTTTWENKLTYVVPFNVILGASWSPDRNYFAFWSLADPMQGTVRVWNTLTGEEVLAHQDLSQYVAAIAWSPDGTRIASDDGHSVEIWDPTTGNIILTLPTDSLVSAIAWSPDGARIAIATETSIQIWDASTGNLLLTYHGQLQGNAILAWSPNGRYIASSGLNDPTVQVWDITNGNLSLTYKGHTAAVTAIAWSPDSRRIATGSQDKTVQIWDASKGNTIFTYHGHTGTVGSIAWSPNGQFIASSATESEGPIQIWWAV